MSNFSDITKYIPQREPIVMVSEICSVSDGEVITKFCFTDDNFFCKNGVLLEPGIIENIAQSAATMNGYNAIKNNRAVKKGFIGSINNLEIYGLPKSQTEIETTVITVNQVMNVSIVKGVLRQNGVVLAQCEMKIFVEE